MKPLTENQTVKLKQTELD